jgi:hypothetical protein
MLGVEVKRSTVATFERINAQQDLNIIRVLWQGNTAGVIREKEGIVLMFPDLDDTAEFPRAMLQKLVGYAAHELGHLWFTDRAPWDAAIDTHGAYLGHLINGLEDPRIERKVYESGRVPNSRNLFEHLINEVTNGEYDPNDVVNYPFFLAVDGRRLNGYPINVAPILERSIHAEPLLRAVNAAHKAGSTDEIVKIAIDLLKEINPPNQDHLDGQTQETLDDGSDRGDGEFEGEDDGEGDGEGEEKGDKQKGTSSGKGREKAIPVEISMHMETEPCKADKVVKRPAIGKPIDYKFPWETA